MNRIQEKLPYSPTWMNHQEAHPVKVHDIKTKEILGKFPTIAEASLFTGLNPQHIHRILKNKSRNRTNKLGKIITIRSLPVH